MGGEDELHRQATQAVGLGCGRRDDHPLLDLGHARAHGLCLTFHLDHAESASPDGLQVGMAAQMRNEDAGLERGVEDGLALLRLDLTAVDRQLHVLLSSLSWAQ